MNNKRRRDQWKNSKWNQKNLLAEDGNKGGYMRSIQDGKTGLAITWNRTQSPWKDFNQTVCVLLMLA